jgi:hypothetical protein
VMKTAATATFKTVGLFGVELSMWQFSADLGWSQSTDLLIKSANCWKKYEASCGPGAASG